MYGCQVYLCCIIFQLIFLILLHLRLYKKLNINFRGEEETEAMCSLHVMSNELAALAKRNLTFNLITVRCEKNDQQF